MEHSNEKLGQLFIIGFPGEEPSAAFLNFLVEDNIGGVILFNDNCSTHETARRNISLIRSHFHDSVPFIAIDQEGGRVCRLKGAPTEFLAPADYGQRDALERFTEDYSRAAVSMVSMGINLNLAPVCDMTVNDENECLKGRCFGGTVEKIGPFVRASVEIAHRAGLLCCLKHFPGLGASKIDPHAGPATADYDYMLWHQRERLSFVAGVEAGADFIMTTHLQVDALDSVIATASEKIVGQLLRKDLNFDGPVITDDLTMKGAESLGHIGERAVAAFNAGHDILLFGQDFEAAMEAYEYFRDACQRGEVNRERLKVAVQSVSGMKSRLDRIEVH